MVGLLVGIQHVYIVEEFVSVVSTLAFYLVTLSEQPHPRDVDTVEPRCGSDVLHRNRGVLLDAVDRVVDFVQ